MSHIKRMFNEEVREKKRTGSGIFSRVSTRKGGSNKALRTPYYYMSAKEKKELNGEAVTIYNMKEIIYYKDFLKRSQKDQIDLMTYWRRIYTVNDITKGMNISKGLYYKVIKQLGLQKRKHKKDILSEERLQEILESPEFIEFEFIKQISPSQRNTIIDNYLKRIEPQTLVSLFEKWEGSDIKYLYNHYRRFEKNKNDEKTLSNVSITIDTPVEKYSENDAQDHIDETITEEEVVPQEFKKTATVAIDSQINIETNSFTFEMKGRYSKDVVIRRVQLALEALGDEEGDLNLEIHINNKK
ncbi:hypothetical protein MF621_004119 (plasmid) [Bacillus velezensis]|uniref:hypothetical protein n=1 Tax=Bacillus velezensis TaxID=492670 RepID=UPI00049F320D|nr:hypothetical protein [Bacillus velezensis]KDN91166.1 hypothetical protein EF87_20390 [Bacillus amyloliquefaciens]URJ80368.1 hypothetical protein MF621_004119 [Bacillus velezensis]WIA44722.1 hypothetical protein MF619_003985 [Bacillus velezensis]